MTDEECPLTANPCRHCSNEHMFRPYMKLDKDPKTGLYKPGGLGNIEIDLGHRCNNVGCWCDELETCPVPVNLILQSEMVEEYNMNKEKERVKEEKRKARKKVVRKPGKKVVKKPVKKVVKKVIKKATKKPVKKPVTKGVTKRKL